jgi:hypothetical protein
MAQGDTPYVLLGVQTDYKRLIYRPTDYQNILTLPITISPGFGVLKAGTVLAKNTSGTGQGNNGMCIPYDPHATITGAEDAPTRAYLVTDGATSAYAYVTLNDSYKFKVGDWLYAIDSDASAVDCSFVTAIDRTTYAHMAKITVTNNVTTGITTANFGYLYIAGADTAIGVLDISVDTGVGANAKGANAGMIISHCVFYSGALVNMDSNARTDVTASTFGQFTYMK